MIRQEIHESFKDAAALSPAALGEGDNAGSLLAVTPFEERITQLIPSYNVWEAD